MENNITITIDPMLSSLVWIIGIPVAVFFVIMSIYYIAKFGNEIITFGSKVLRIFCFLGGWVKKESISSEFEGRINSIVKEYNKDFNLEFLPPCKITWVSDKNQECFLNGDEAILCMNFDRKNQNVNYLNATHQYVKTAFISKSKLFIENTTKDAFDLIATHKFLKNHRREVLQEFNILFSEIDTHVKSEFERFFPTDQAGLFSSILIPELFHFGESIPQSAPPTSNIKKDITRFIEWFYLLATRDWDERTELVYESTHFKVGVILVAKQETWERYGKDAYVRWGVKYATDNFNAVYILAIGKDRYTKATIVADELKNAYGFEQINKNPKIFIIDPETDEPQSLTCYSLRPNSANLQHNAWEIIYDTYTKGNAITAIVHEVASDNITVNVSGLLFVLNRDVLSSASLRVLTSFFRKGQELILNITKCEKYETASLSNVDTETDPKMLIEYISSNPDKKVDAVVKSIVTNKEGETVGLRVVPNDDIIRNLEVFIHKSNASLSRFTNLNEKYHIGGVITILINEYDPKDKSLVGKVLGLSDPWGSSGEIHRIAENSVHTMVIKELTNYSIKGEITEGIECIVKKQEISFNKDECETSNVNINDNLSVFIFSIDYDRRIIFASIKRVNATAEQLKLLQTKDNIIRCEIIEVNPRIGLSVKNEDNSVNGIIPNYEICWGNSYPQNRNFHAGDNIDVKILQINPDNNTHKCSHKRVYTHNFDSIKQFISVGQEIEGTVLKSFNLFSEISIKYKNISCVGYISNQDISNIVRIYDGDLQHYLAVGSTYYFNIKAINDQNKSIVLDRIAFLDSYEKPEIGEVSEVTIVKVFKNKMWFYSDNLEGYIIGSKGINIGDKVSVIPVASDGNEYVITK